MIITLNVNGIVHRLKDKFADRTKKMTQLDLPQRYRCSETPGYLHLNVYSSNVHNSQTVEVALLSIERWMDKKDMVSVYNGIFLSH